MIDIAESDDAHRIGSFRNLVVALWKGALTVESGGSLTALIGQQCAAHGGAGLISIIEVGADMPSPAARAALAEGLKKHDGVMIAAATVFEGTGFKAAAVRATITSVSLLTRNRSPSKVFALTDDAALWLAPLLGKGKVSVTASEIVAAIRELRQ